MRKRGVVGLIKATKVIAIANNIFFVRSFFSLVRALFARKTIIKNTPDEYKMSVSAKGIHDLKSWPRMNSKNARKNNILCLNFSFIR